MAERITLSDGSGCWFDARKSQIWQGVQGEILYQSICLLWVLHRPAKSSHGDCDVVVEIETQEAAAWLSRNGHPIPLAAGLEIPASGKA